MIRYQILGQSNYAIAILLETLRRIHSERIAVTIVSNIPREENDSLVYSYGAEGIEATEISHDRWAPDPAARLLMGSIGRARERIYTFFSDRFGIDSERYSNTLDPQANLAHQVTLGRGVHVSPGATVAPYVTLGDFVVINRNASVGHHTTLGSFVTINPGVDVAGVCRIERGVTIGVGACVVDGITIGANSIVGAGSVVTRSLPRDVLAYGVPAKIIRSR